MAVGSRVVLASIALATAGGITIASSTCAQELRMPRDIGALFVEFRKTRSIERRVEIVGELEELFRAAFAAYEADKANEAAFFRANSAGAVFVDCGGLRPDTLDSFLEIAAVYAADGRDAAATFLRRRVGSFQVRQGATEAARDTYRLILPGSPAIGRAEVHVELAQLERLAGAIPEAEKLLDRGLEIAEELTDAERDIVVCQVEIQRVHLLISRGLNVEAFKQLRGLRGRVSARMRREYAANAIDALIALDRSERALRECEKALEEFPGAPDFGMRHAQVSIQLARTQEDPSRRVELLDGAIESVRAIMQRPPSMSAVLTCATMELDALEARGDVAPEHVMPVIARIRSLAAHGDESLLSRLAHATALESRCLFDGAGPRERARLRDRLQTMFDRLVERWQRMPPRRQPYPFLHYKNRRFVLGELLHAIVATGETSASRDALEQVLRVQRLGSMARRGGGDDVSLDDARRALAGPDQGLLIYSFGWRRSMVFAMDRDDLVHAEIEVGGAELQQTTRRLVDSILAGRDHADQARELAALLVPEAVRSRLDRWRSVAFVSTQDVGFVPFAELPLAAGEKPLRTRAATSYLPSLPAGVITVRRAMRARFGSDFVILSEPSPSPEVVARWQHVDRRPDAGPIAESARRVTDASRVQSSRGASATLEALASAQAQTARVAVVLAHGVVTDRPCLVLAPSDSSDGLVDGADVRDALAGAEGYAPLVTLYACGVGQGAARGGEDMSNLLAGAFLEAGSRAVLVAPGTLMRDDACALAAAFHRELRSGLGPAEALRRAQERLGLCGLLHIVGDGSTPIFR